MANTTRRALLKAAPVLALTPASALAAVPDDPILPIYRRWREAHDEWMSLPDKDGDNLKELALEATEDEAFWQIVGMTPTSMAGIAAMAHVFWTVAGPDFREGSEEYLEELALPDNKMLAAIWRCASGESGVPSA